MNSKEVLLSNMAELVTGRIPDKMQSFIIEDRDYIKCEKLSYMSSSSCEVNNFHRVQLWLSNTLKIKCLNNIASLSADSSLGPVFYKMNIADILLDTIDNILSSHSEFSLFVGTNQNINEIVKDDSNEIDMLLLPSNSDDVRSIESHINNGKQEMDSDEEDQEEFSIVNGTKRSTILKLFEYSFYDQLKENSNFLKRSGVLNNRGHLIRTEKKKIVLCFKTIMALLKSEEYLSCFKNYKSEDCDTKNSLNSLLLRLSNYITCSITAVQYGAVQSICAFISVSMKGHPVKDLESIYDDSVIDNLNDKLRETLRISSGDSLVIIDGLDYVVSHVCESVISILSTLNSIIVFNDESKVSALYSVRHTIRIEITNLSHYIDAIITFILHSNVAFMHFFIAHDGIHIIAELASLTPAFYLDEVANLKGKITAMIQSLYAIEEKQYKSICNRLENSTEFKSILADRLHYEITKRLNSKDSIQLVSGINALSIVQMTQNKGLIAMIHEKADISLLDMIITFSESDYIGLQRASVEFYVHFLSDKTNCSQFLLSGTLQLQQLFMSPDLLVSARALVAMSKIMTVGVNSSEKNDKGVSELATPIKDCKIPSQRKNKPNGAGQDNEEDAIVTEIFSDEDSDSITDTETSGVKNDASSIEKLFDIAETYILDKHLPLSVRKWAIESLAYLSLDAVIKERLVANKLLLEYFIEIINRSYDKSLLYVLLSMLRHIFNAFERKQLSDEEQKMKELQSLAKQETSVEQHFDGSEFIEKRIKQLMDINIVEQINVLYHKLDKTPQTLEVVASILHTLAKNPYNRGRLVATGAHQILLEILTKRHHPTPAGYANDYLTNDNGKPDSEKFLVTAYKVIASQALAKIAISTNPNIAFKGEKANELVKPLLQLATSSYELHIFEALLALTNLASMNDYVRKKIYLEDGVSVFYNFQFDDNKHVQRAATEALVNMLLLKEVYDMYTTKDGKHRDDVKLWLSLAGDDSDNIQINCAAAAGLVFMSSELQVCNKIAEAKQGIVILKDLLAMSFDAAIRGIHIVHNFITSSPENATVWVDSDNSIELLLALIKLHPNTPIAEISSECLAYLSDHKFIQPV